MAVFTSPKYKNLLVAGGGKFKDGRLEVDGAKAERVRSLVDDARFGITEEKSASRSTKTAPKAAEPDKDADDK